MEQIAYPVTVMGMVLCVIGFGHLPAYPPFGINAVLISADSPIALSAVSRSLVLDHDGDPHRSNVGTESTRCPQDYRSANVHCLQNSGHLAWHFPVVLPEEEWPGSGRSLAAMPSPRHALSALGVVQVNVRRLIVHL